MVEPAIVLRPGRERSLVRRHPWIFSGGIERIVGAPGPGDTVRVVAADGTPLARAAYHQGAALAARVWTFDPDEVVDDAFIARRVERAAAARAGLAATTDGCRLVFAESDGLPGVVVDHYGPQAVAQLTSVGAERWRDVVVAAVGAVPGVEAVYERSDGDARAREGLPNRRAPALGPEPLPLVEFREGPWRFVADVVRGHKTGFYLDQRANRPVVAALAPGRRVLDVCCSTGSFAVAAATAGAATVTGIDSSGPALTVAREHLARNGVPEVELVEADAFADLRRRRDRGEQFDLVVLDPPKLAAHDGQVPRASRAYKDLNWLALRLLAPGGHLVTFSCSGAVSEDLFQKILFGAALDARRDVWIEQRLGQASDHPVLVTFPEAAYLKGFVCRVD